MGGMIKKNNLIAIGIITINKLSFHTEGRGRRRRFPAIMFRHHGMLPFRGRASANGVPAAPEEAAQAQKGRAPPLRPQKSLRKAAISAAGHGLFDAQKNAATSRLRCFFRAFDRQGVLFPEGRICGPLHGKNHALRP
ncbi:hypothetical protein [uncultured Mailhella sp.]|uniref:hypothetical protein n=1 Tax=uncultured Mailhella sp. TaxID=1981031 RepID=UPI0025F22B5D|nr:hypothetical protein [uncultured Mailhella sp.]